MYPCIAGTWLGTCRYSWNNAANWCNGVIPSAASNVIIGPSANQPTIGAARVCKTSLLKQGNTDSVGFKYAYSKWQLDQ
jgi:hypothetical protein